MADNISVLETNIYVQGSLACAEFTAPAGSIDNDAMEANAQVSASKLQHEHRARFASESATSPGDEAHVVHVGRASGSVLYVGAGCVVPGVADGKAHVDLLRDGVSILGGAMVIGSSFAAYGLTTTAITSAPYVAGDIFEWKIIASAAGGTVPKGVYAEARLLEQYV